MTGPVTRATGTPLPPVKRLDELINVACATYAEGTAASGPDGRITYSGLAAQASTLADALARAEVGEGDAVVVAVSNHCTDFIAQLAVWQRGAVVVPLHRRSPAAVLVATVERTGARIVVVDDVPTAWAGALAEGLHPFVWEATATPRSRPRELNGDQALVVFTSGSTGHPKGVVLSHAAFTGKLAVNQRALKFEPESRSLHVLHQHFSFGQWTSLLTLATGGQLDLVERFDAGEVLGRLAAEQFDRIAVVPTMLRQMLPLLEAERAARPSLVSRMRQVGSPGLWIAGGEPLAAGLGRRFRSQLPHAGISDVFGLSESATSDFIVPPEEYDEAAGTIGFPSDCVQAMAVGDEGPVRNGELGELWLRTSFLMTGYLDDPVATQAAVEGGWLRTGDLVRVRVQDGRYELAGRSKSLIVRGGHKISPLEIEGVFSELPGVSGVIAVGFPDDVLGERIHLLVASADETYSVLSLRQWGRERLDAYKLPDDVHSIAMLPLGVTGKADRIAARQIVQERLRSRDLAMEPVRTTEPTG